jgi:hypothetical protein
MMPFVLSHRDGSLYRANVKQTKNNVSLIDALYLSIHSLNVSSEATAFWRNDDIIPCKDFQGAPVM